MKYNTRIRIKTAGKKEHKVRMVGKCRVSWEVVVVFAALRRNCMRN